MVLVQYIFDQAFIHNDGGYGATIAVALFVIVVGASPSCSSRLSARGGSNDDGRRQPSASAKVVLAASSTSASILLTILTVICAAVWFFPLYWAVVTSFKPEDEVVAPTSSSCPYTRPWPATNTCSTHSNILIWYLNSTITSRRHNRSRHRHRDLLRLRHLAAPLSRPHAAVVGDPRELHDPGAGADHQPLHHHGRRQAAQYLSRHHPAAADRAGDRHRLQAVLRFRAARLSRGGGDRRRQRVPAPLPHLPADELGRDHRARDHHLHRRVERVPVAVPRLARPRT